LVLGLIIFNCAVLKRILFYLGVVFGTFLYTSGAYAQTTPTVPAVSICGAGTVTLTASGSTPAGGTYNWYTAAAGGTLLQSSTSGTFTATITATTNYYVSYTRGGTSGRRAVTATVNAEPVISALPSTPAASFYLAYPFTGNANDATTNADNGTVQGGATLTTDRFGRANNAYNFNGSSQYISTATASASPGPLNFSISVWFRTTSAGGLLVGYGASQTGSSSMYDRHIYMSDAGQIYYGIYPGGAQTINSTASYDDGNWHNAVVTTSSTTGSTLYVDGQLQDSDPTMTTCQTYGTTGYWRVGYNNLGGWTNQPTDFYFNGDLDDIAIYKSALTAAQIYSLYGAGSTPVCTGSTLSLQVNTVAGATYSWSGPNSFTSTSQNPTVSGSATTAMAGTYTCTVTGANGCTSTITANAIVYPPPSATFTGTSSVASTTNSTITYTGTDPATSTYSWNFGGGSPATGTGQGPFSVQWSTPGTKTITLTVTNANGCSANSTQTVTVNGGPYGNYAFNKTVTLNTTSLGITSNLTNFPALLSITDPDLVITGICTDKLTTPNGPNYDFAFVSGGAELNYQLESYNQTTGTLLVWVQIPSLTFATNNTIYFYYGSPSPTVTHNTAFFNSTWGSDYKAVFHFNEITYTGNVTDGTANGHTGTANNMTSANLVTGKIGTAYNFNGSSTSISSNAVTITGAFTISAWVKLAAVGPDQKIMTNQTSVGSTSGGYKLGVYTNDIPETESGTAIDRGSTPLPTALTAGTWHYIQGVYSGTTLSTYVDGTQYENFSTTTNPSSTNPFYIGVGEGGAQYFLNGIIDEPRVSNVAKTSDWIKAEYVDQGNPVSFTSVGTTRSIAQTNAASTPGALTYTWTGGAGTTDPTNANNWDNTTAGTINQLPSFTGSTTLVIPNGLSFYPALTANESIYGLTIANGASFNLNGHTLSVGCNIYNSSGGQILYGSNNTSGITWNGSAATQTYTGANTSNTTQLGSMTINNSAGGTVTLSGGPVDIYSSLNLTKGNLVINSSPTILTLKSTATQTANVTAITSGYSITGNVNVERYISGGTATYRGYRLLSSPVYAGTVSSNNVYSINYLKNSVYLTGTSASGGLDNTAAANPTMYLFRENLNPLYTTFLNSNFKGINNINSAPTYSMDDAANPSINIPVGNGYLCFFRGNRATNTYAQETVTTYVPQAATLSTSGTLNQGQIAVKDWFTPSVATLSYTAASPVAIRGYNLVGNPYACAIDWETFQTATATTGIYGTSVGTSIYVLDPISHNYGVYMKGNAGVGTNHASNIIVSGQGFFVLATSASAQLIFNESAKSNTQVISPQLLFAKKTDALAINKYLRLQMVMDSVDYDDILIRFNDTLKDQKYAEAIDAAYKSGQGKISLWSQSADSMALAINTVPFPKQTQEVIHLNTTVTTDGVYSLNMKDMVGIPEFFDIWLMDAYKKDSLDVRHNSTYSFNVYKSDTNSFGANRFSLVFRQNPAYAYSLLSFSAAKNETASTAKQVQINWTTQNEQDYTNFTIERSTDGGKTYPVIGSMTASGQGNYNIVDNSPGANNLYRLQSEDLNGNITYSNIVPIAYTNASSNLVQNNITVYPNPAKSTINLTILNDAANAGDTYSILITNSSGLVVKQATSRQTSWQSNIADLLPGSYVIRVTGKKEQKDIGIAKFVKL
jgi:trimeric autotransporter adhesin